MLRFAFTILVETIHEMPQKVVHIADSWRLYLKQGYAALRAGDEPRATRAFEAAYKGAPNDPLTLRAMGRLRMQQGEHEEAERLLSCSLELQGRDAATAASLARVLGLHLKRPVEALAVLNKALMHSPYSILLQVVRGEISLDAGELDEAHEAFDRVIARNASHTAARQGLARTYNLKGIRHSEAGQLEQAAFAFKHAADLDQRWSAPHVNLGVVMGRLGKPLKAIVAFEAALARDPHNPVAHFDLGHTYHTLGEIGEATRTIERLLRICPDYPQARLLLANVLVDRGELDRAIALLLEEIESHGDSVQAWSTLGLAHICNGNVDHGERCLRHALDLDPKHFNAYYNLAVLYATQKRQAEADEVLRQAFEADPQRTHGTLQRKDSSLLRMQKPGTD